MDDSNQTRYSFAEKWRAASNYQVDGIESFDSDTLGWIIKRNGFDSLDSFGVYIRKFDSILDAGCGNGRILGLMAELARNETKLFGLDFSAADIARRNLGSKVAEIHDADLTDKATLEEIGSVDFIYCQEVLHHTSDPQLAFQNLVNLLLPGGEIAIYVYKEKAPVREFTDDFVRELVKDLDVDSAMKIAAEFAELGRVLSGLNVEFEVPTVKALGIEGGRYSIQRFLYHFFAKCYWNPELSAEHNTMINYDWYHPSLCSRHTLEETLNWFEKAGLTVIHSYVDEYGITLRGVKSAP